MTDNRQRGDAHWTRRRKAAGLPARGLRPRPSADEIVRAVNMHLDTLDRQTRQTPQERPVTNHLDLKHTVDVRLYFHKVEGAAIVIEPNLRGNPIGQLAVAEVRFYDGVLAGHTLCGFGIWERRSGTGRNVTFPARQYSVNGERRSFALVRPLPESIGAQDRLRDLILEAYHAYEQAHTAQA